MYHITLFMESVVFEHVLLQASLHHLVLFGEPFFCDFSFHATSKMQRSEFQMFQMNFKCASLTFEHLDPGRRTSLVEGKGSILMLPAAWTMFPH